MLLHCSTVGAAGTDFCEFGVGFVAMFFEFVSFEWFVTGFKLRTKQ